MSSYQREREALGERLRELRRDARLTGRELAESQAWHPSKVSKIESGKQTPSDADLEAWVRVCDAEGRLNDLLAALRSLETRYQEHRRQFRHGVAAVQREFGKAEAESDIVRCFESTFVPGLLQTCEYARHRLVNPAIDQGGPDDIDDAVAARMERQQVLYRRDKRFHFVITEAALHYRLCPPDVLAGQLDRLVSATTLPNVRFGVIPFEKEYPVEPIHGFWLFDDRLVRVEVFTAELQLAEESEIAAYSSIFAKLAAVASYGSEARAIIARASERLAGSLGGPGVTPPEVRDDA